MYICVHTFSFLFSTNTPTHTCIPYTHKLRTNKNLFFWIKYVSCDEQYILKFYDGEYLNNVKNLIKIDLRKKKESKYTYAYTKAFITNWFRFVTTCEILLQTSHKFESRFFKSKKNYSSWCSNIFWFQRNGN